MIKLEIPGPCGGGDGDPSKTGNDETDLKPRRRHYGCQSGKQLHIPKLFADELNIRPCIDQIVEPT